MPGQHDFARRRNAKRDAEAAVASLWHRLVALARAPAWYRRGGVADTMAGRFDAVCLVLALALLRMEDRPALRQETAWLTEVFVRDMDGQLRESGIGDLAVGKHIGRLMAVLGGRLGALRVALADADDAALGAVLIRNMTLVEGADVAAVVPMVRDLAQTFGGLDDAALLAGAVPVPAALQ